MDEPTRRKLAYAVAREAGGSAGSVYSYDDCGHTHMSGAGSSMYDYGSRSHFSKSYDYGRGAHWSFKVSGDKFSGYDYGFGHHFSGTIRGRNISIYDYGDGRHHSYTV